MTFTVEPMLTLGGYAWDIWDDGLGRWSPRDRSWVAQWGAHRAHHRGRPGDPDAGVLAGPGLLSKRNGVLCVHSRQLTPFSNRFAGMADADVIVVGAGLAGLVATAELADAGRSVILLDQEPEQRPGAVRLFWSFGGLFLGGTRPSSADCGSPTRWRLGPAGLAGRRGFLTGTPTTGPGCGAEGPTWDFAAG